MRKFRATIAAALVAASCFAVAPARADGGEDLVLVGIDQAGDGAITGDPTLATLGYDVLALYIHQPDLSKPVLEFVWQLTDLPPVTPNEVTRYLWTFLVNGKQYQVMAKQSDVASATAIDNPPNGAVEQATTVQGAFRVRGNCETVGGTLLLCHHLAWATGEFDIANKQVKVRVPLDSAALPDIRPGAVIDPDPSQGAQAGAQVIVSNSSTTDVASMCANYTIPEGGVPIGSDGGCD